MALSDAVQAVVNAVDALEAEVNAQPAAPEVDAVRKAVEDVLTSEGWTAPVPEVPADQPAPEGN